jgi:hypothetical protein
LNRRRFGGEYIARIYLEERRRPGTSVKEIPE